jgi:hypothetical protein
MGEVFPEDWDEKKVKKVIRKEVKRVLSKLLADSVFEERNNKKSGKFFSLNAGTVAPTEPSLNESIDIYGTLTNSSTRKSDLIFDSMIEFNVGTRLVSYTVSNKDLFTTFPAAGTYQGPYKGCKPVFIEVLTRVDDFFICRAATQLRYLELLSIEGEKKNEKNS